MIASADGCKGGWLVALAESWPCERLPDLKVAPNFIALITVTQHCDAVVVDMPIGLASGAERRDCDQLARERLGAKGGSRVFDSPPRECLGAPTVEEFQDIHRAMRGKGAGLPVWGIVPKLKEINTLMSPGLQDRVYEFHPELTWHHLAGETLESKHTSAGLLQRIHYLQKNSPGIFQINDSPVLQKVKLDDVLDALVGLSAAQAIFDGPDYTRRLPAEKPKSDKRGLRMEMWY